MKKTNPGDMYNAYKKKKTAKKIIKKGSVMKTAIKGLI